MSRNASRVLRLFDLKGQRLGHEWMIRGDTSLLDLERRVHQRYRWDQRRSLRLEGQIFTAAPLADSAPDGWILGPCADAEIGRPLGLLRLGVIDGWLGPWPDVPSADDGELAVVQLSQAPLVLAAPDGHPLLQRPSAISPAELCTDDLWPLAPGAFPCLQRELVAQGLNWPAEDPAPEERQPLRPAGHASSGEVMLATAISLPRLEPTHVALPLQWPQPLLLGDALVVRREFCDHPRLQDLLQSLQSRLEPWFAQAPELRPAGEGPEH